MENNMERRMETITADELAKALREQDSSWHFDKKIPISTILTIFAQTIVVVFWASSVEFRVGALTKATVSERWVTEVSMRLEAIENTLKEVKDSQTIEDKVQKTIQKLRIESPITTLP